MIVPSRWIRWLPWVSLAAFTLLWLARWPTFPLVLDPYYHLLVARQIADAGGPIVYEWWEYAPGGRPHLYPPLLHLLLALLLKSGASPILAIRLLSVSLLPGLLLSMFLVARRLLGASVAAAALWMGMLPFSFHLHSAITLAATLGMILMLWLVDALERGRGLAAGLLIALLYYTHLSLPWMALVAVTCYGVYRPSVRGDIKNASWGLLPALPWIVHIVRHRAAFHPFPREENTLIELMPLLYVMGAVGLWRCWRLKGPFLWPLACWLGLSLLSFRYPFRWLSGEGMLPVILLAGVAVDWASSRMMLAWTSNPMRRRRGTEQQILGSFFLFVLLAMSPTFAHTTAGWRWRWPDSAPWHLTGSRAVTPKEVDASLYTPPMAKVIAAVAAQSRPNEILWANAPYALGLIAALAHRPIASAMLNEVTASVPADPLRAAHLIIWFTFQPIPGTVTWSELKRLPLTLVAATEIALIFRQSNISQRARPPNAVLPFGVALLLLLSAIAAIIWDMRRPALR